MAEFSYDGKAAYLTKIEVAPNEKGMTLIILSLIGEEIAQINMTVQEVQETFFEVLSRTQN